MRSILRMMTLALALSLVATPAGAAAPTATDSGTKLDLSNGHVLVTFEGKKPVLHVFPGGETPLPNATGAFTYRFEGLSEVREVAANGTPAPTSANAVASLALDTASWNVTLDQADGRAVVNLALHAPVTLASGVTAPTPGVVPNLTLPQGDADVSLIFTIRDADTKLGLGNVDLGVPSTSVASELRVRAWPFVDATNDRLQLETLASGLVERAAGAGVDSAIVKTNATPVGSLAWATVANATGKNGAPTTVAVRTALAASPNGTRIAQTFDAPDVSTLTHHAALGLVTAAAGGLTSGAASSGAAKAVPAPGLVVAIGAVAVGAVVLRRFI